jgi:hypothetical protein
MAALNWPKIGLFPSVRFTARFTRVSVKRAVPWTRHVSRFTPL